ncbi:MAG: double-cubane-cluster-containing anaerobic reductase [Firmicutes bacterium]|nr:double-cubane-cluster-containing anaerobic reductase [Bacillota bacterium]
MADNYAMWKELGMDIETHDMLCEVLPGAIGDVFMSQENRPEKMDFFDMVLADVHGIRPAELVEFRKNGGKVFGTFCAYVPDEVIFAAGGIATGLCAGSQFWVPGGERYLPANTCPLIKAMLGARFDKTCPFYRLADMYIGENTCDGKKKAYEILGTDVPMHVMDLPQMKRDKDIVKWADEIKELIAVVEEVTGNKVTPEALSEEIKVINAKRQALQRLYDLRKNAKAPISGTDTLLISQIAYYDDPKRFTQMVNVLCDELDQRVADGVDVAPGAKRILISGTPMAIPNWKMHNIIETSGGVVVCEETCTGTRYFEGQVDESGETLDEMVMNIAERYMGINCACFTPNEGRFDDVIRLAKEYNVDGVIDVNLKFCTTYDIEGYTLEQRLNEAGIKVLGIETDYTDNDAQQIKTRVEAFIETLA